MCRAIGKGKSIKLPGTVDNLCTALTAINRKTTGTKWLKSSLHRCNFFKKIFGRKQAQEPIQEKIQLEPEENKPNRNIKKFKTKVVGVTFAGRQSYLKRLANDPDEDLEFQDISLEREPNNKHDPNAIKVVWHKYNERTDEEKDLHLGYIAAHVAESLARDIDNGVKVSVYPESILGGFDYDEERAYGMLLSVEIDRSNS